MVWITGLRSSVVSRRATIFSVNQVVLCIDRNMFVPLLVTLKSLEPFADNLEFTVLGVELDSAITAHIRRVCPAPLRVLDISDDLIPHYFPQCKWLTQAAYGRLLAPHYYDNDISRIVYLDSDVVVKESLDFLFQVDLGDSIIGACQANEYPVFRRTDRYCETLRVDSPDVLEPGVLPYLNSGVMVIDVHKYLEEQVFEKCRAYIQENGRYLQTADEDALNFILAGNFKRLPARWNQESVCRRPAYQHHRGLDITRDEIAEMLNNPAIVHYNGWSKPWRPLWADPRAGEWLELQRAVARLRVRPSTSS